MTGVCVIVDTNVAPLVFARTPHRDFLPVFRWLHDAKQDGRLVLGGKLARELAQIERVRGYLHALHQAGRAIRISHSAIAAHDAEVRRLALCVSDDTHIIALARASGARTLCSGDHDLHRDFKNPRLIGSPPGSVYQNPRHRHLLRHTTSCKRQCLLLR